MRILVKAGLSYRAIAATLGLTKSTVAYHARRLDRRADARYARRYDWTEIRAAYEGGLTMAECQARFGFSRHTWYQAVRRGDIVLRQWILPLEQLLVVGRKTSRGHLKSRLVAAGLKESRCEECGLAEWRGRPLGMALHHVNGNGADNRLENLVFLCPNCHAQTPNYGGRNGHRRRIATA